MEKQSTSKPGEPYTLISQIAYNAAKNSLTAQEAINALARVPMRTFKDVLAAYGNPNTIKARIVNGLCDNNSSRKRESENKKVQNWLTGKSRPTNRVDLWELCFILEMNLDHTDAFLASVSEYGIHWRNPMDLTLAFALRQKMRWAETRPLLEKAKAITEHARKDVDTSYTLAIRNDFATLQTAEDLEGYLVSCSGNMGVLHNTAWQYFNDYLSILESPFGEAGNQQGMLNLKTKEPRYSVRKILETYFDQKLSALRKDKRKDEKVKLLLKDWPDEVSISRIRNRMDDVPRRVLILLFLATDGIDEQEDEDWFVDDGEDVRFDDSYDRMNQVLYQCGYNKLDPRNPFDWLMIYCMREDSENEITDGANGRLTEVLDLLFLPES